MTPAAQSSPQDSKQFPQAPFVLFVSCMLQQSDALTCYRLISKVVLTHVHLKHCDSVDCVCDVCHLHAGECGLCL